MTISLYCKKPGLNGGSKRQIRVSTDSAMLALAALARSSLMIFRDSSSVALPRNDLATQVSESNSRNFTCESFGCGKWPTLEPDGITNETYHSLDAELSAF